MSVAASVTSLSDLRLYRRGKVRDTYRLGDDLLMVASDRVSAFDVVLPTPIPGKGVVLTQLSRFWFDRSAHIVPNHVITADPAEFPVELGPIRDALTGRSMLVRRAERIDVECVMRGYLAGSAWAEYRDLGSVAGHALPSGLAQASELPEPIFTPAIKSDTGHDINVTRADLRERLGLDLAQQLEDRSRDLYLFARGHAFARGIIIADTKFEYGFVNGELTLIDELLTPDSSRFWAAGPYGSGQGPESFDKQYLRDWLVTTGWDKAPPGPALPLDVVAGTASRYREALDRLTDASAVEG